MNIEEYRSVLIDINQKWGSKAERYILLVIAFICSWPIFIPIAIIHAKIAGLNKDDQDLLNFYLPIFVLSALINLSSYPLIETSLFIPFIYFSIVFDYFIKIFILIDAYKSLVGEKPPTIKIISFPEKSFNRKSVKGSIFPEAKL